MDDTHTNRRDPKTTETLPRRSLRLRVQTGVQTAANKLDRNLIPSSRRSHPRKHGDSSEGANLSTAKIDSRNRDLRVVESKGEGGEREDQGKLDSCNAPRYELPSPRDGLVEGKAKIVLYIYIYIGDGIAFPLKDEIIPCVKCLAKIEWPRPRKRSENGTREFIFVSGRKRFGGGGEIVRE